MTDLSIQHDPEKQRFAIAPQQGRAELTYRVQGGGQNDSTLIDFNHTFVSPDLQGQGVGKELVRHGFEWARHQSYIVRASCPFAARFLD